METCKNSIGHNLYANNIIYAFDVPNTNVSISGTWDEIKETVNTFRTGRISVPEVTCGFCKTKLQ